MQDLIKIELRQIGNEKILSGSLRDVWKYLESKKQFADWVKDGIRKGGFQENVDYIVHKIMNSPEQGKQVVDKIEYIGTIDMAKHLAMMERNEIGHRVRQYFIEVEKFFKEQLSREFNEWYQKRIEGKITREELMDTIKQLVEYAKLQESTQPERYYSIITILINSSLFGCPSGRKLKINIRDYLSRIQLVQLESCEGMVRKSIAQSIANGLHYKEIYQVVKSKVIAYAEVIGKDIPELLKPEQYQAIAYKKDLPLLEMMTR